MLNCRANAPPAPTPLKKSGTPSRKPTRHCAVHGAAGQWVYHGMATTRDPPFPSPPWCLPRPPKIISETHQPCTMPYWKVRGKPVHYETHGLTTNAFHSYWAPKTKTWYCPHKLCIRAYQTHVCLHLTDVNFEYAIHCSFNKKNRVYQDLWFRICVPTCFSPQLYMVQSAWAWASSVMSAPPPTVLGRDRNSRAEATLFFIKSITWTSLKLHVISLFLAQGEHIVDRLPFWGDITWCHCNLSRLCDILLHIIIIFLPLASIICFGFLSCIFGKN